MNWKTKCVASYFLSKAPCSMTIYNLIQKHYTKRWDRNVEATLSGPNHYVNHLKLFTKHWGDLSTARYFEFGVARDLFSNLFNWCAGIEHQLAIDLNPLATTELVNHAVEQLRAVSNPFMIRQPNVDLGPDFRKDAQLHYGIEYRAPSDARKVDREDGSIDLIATTSTFEHIPERTVREILTECHRLCHKGSIMSHVVDYHDHYSHLDRTITPYNFLKFTDKQWDLLYMRHYYQNRLRHHDIRKLFLDAGFTILEEIKTIPENAIEMISSIKLSDQFKDRPIEDLLPTSGHFILTKE